MDSDRLFPLSQQEQITHLNLHILINFPNRDKLKMESHCLATWAVQVLARVHIYI
jgi:hypothetical protein